MIDKAEMRTNNINYKFSVNRIFYEADFISLLGIKLEDVDVGRCDTSLEIANIHRQHLGRVHGGVLVTLSGHAATGAATSLIRDTQDVVSVEFKINILRSTESGYLFCRGRVIKPGGTLIICEAEVFAGTDITGKLVAKSTFTFMVIDKIGEFNLQVHQRSLS
ncbi:PaaI family thioesterase [Geothermobacter ehrlichii]|uniref:PaaI family thioesterase n=1 Tax=Geothermobacter ehrlichii TaxID=213224 RepID=UPI0011E7B80D|nr:PaaI family thioesterase [Geothermobacter ehrlichii]